MASENEFCKNPTSKDTITTIDSESYDSIGGHKHSLDQDTGGKQGEMPQTEFEASAKGLKVSSPILGVIILSQSLAFFYLYLIYVYPVEDIF